MKVSAEFLVIENNEAVLKVIKKKIDTHDYLIDFKNTIKKIDRCELIERLAQKKINDRLVLCNLLSEEYDEHFYEKEARLGSINLMLTQGDVNKEQENLYDNYEKDRILFYEFDKSIQQIFSRKILKDILNNITKKYEAIKNKEKNIFIKKMLEESHIAFCKEYNPIGWSSFLFKYKDIKIYRSSNLKYGSLSYDYVNIELDGIKKILGIREEKFYCFEFCYKTRYRITEVKDVLNEYLTAPSEYRKELLKNNIKYLKELLRKEQVVIPKLENFIIPQLEEEMKKYNTDSEKHKSLGIELSKYSDKWENKNFNFEYNSNKIIGIQDRRKRIKLLKTEINSLIKIYKSEEDLLDYV